MQINKNAKHLAFQGQLVYERNVRVDTLGGNADEALPFHSGTLLLPEAKFGFRVLQYFEKEKP